MKVIKKLIFFYLEYFLKKMYWAYDSYCHIDIYDYIEQFNKDELLLRVEEDMNDYIHNEISQIDYEFVLGVSIYVIRIGHSFSEEYLRKLRNIVIDSLLNNCEFDNWGNSEKRKLKITHERLIVNNLLKGRKISFGKLIEKFNDSSLKK